MLSLAVSAFAEKAKAASPSGTEISVLTLADSLCGGVPCRSKARAVT